MNKDQEKSQEISEELMDRYLLFRIGEESFAVPLSYVMEIVNIQSITVIPNVPDYVKGIVNLRGRVFPVIDLRLKLGMEEREYDDKTSIVMIDINEERIGLIIDLVIEVRTIESTAFAAPPGTSLRDSLYISGICTIGNDHVRCIDCDKLLQRDFEY